MIPVEDMFLFAYLHIQAFYQNSGSKKDVDVYIFGPWTYRVGLITVSLEFRRGKRGNKKKAEISHYIPGSE